MLCHQLVINILNTLTKMAEIFKSFTAKDNSLFTFFPAFFLFTSNELPKIFSIKKKKVKPRRSNFPLFYGHTTGHA